MVKITFATCLLLVALLAYVQTEGIKLELKSKVQSEVSEGRFLATAEKPLTNYENNFYFSEIGFGKDSKTGKINWSPMIFDTGSAWLWATTKGCLCDNVPKDGIVDLTNTDFKETQKFKSIGYGRGSANGPVGTLTVYLTEEIFYEDQIILAANDIQDFPASHTNGFFGLSHKMGSENHPTLIDNLYTSGKIAQKLFTISLGSQSDKSWITIGEVDHSNVLEGEQFTYSPVVTTGDSDLYYTLTIDQIKFGTASVTNHYGIADTGTSWIGLPPSLASSFYSDSAFKSCTSEYDIYTCPCDGTYPSIDFTIAGKTYSLTQADLMTPAETKGQCMITIEPVQLGNNAFILGDVFLRTVVTVFDLENESVGFAPVNRQ